MKLKCVKYRPCGKNGVRGISHVKIAHGRLENGRLSEERYELLGLCLHLHAVNTPSCVVSWQAPCSASRCTLSLFHHLAGGIVTYTRNICDWWSTSCNLSPVLSEILSMKQILNSFSSTWHPTITVLILMSFAMHIILCRHKRYLIRTTFIYKNYEKHSWSTFPVTWYPVMYWSRLVRTCGLSCYTPHSYVSVTTNEEWCVRFSVIIVPNGTITHGPVNVRVCCVTKPHKCSVIFCSAEVKHFCIFRLH